MHRACDFLEVPLGGGGECSHRTHILVYISDGATPSRLHNPHPQVPAYLQEDLRADKAAFLSLFHRTLQGGKGIAFSGNSSRGRLAVMEEFCSVPCRT